MVIWSNDVELFCIKILAESVLHIFLVFCVVFCCCCFISLRLVSCVLNVANVYVLSILYWPFDFLSRLFVLYLVFSMLPVYMYFPFFIDPLIFSHVYLSCVLCSQCCQCICIVHSLLTLWFSLTFICLVSCVLNVASVYVFSILYWPFDFLSRLFVLCLVS
jgi:hypothetical protein